MLNTHIGFLAKPKETMSIKFMHSVLGPFRSFSTKITPKTLGSAQVWAFPTKPTSTTEWTDQQSQVLTAVSSKQSVFITGSAGTGKTFLLKRVINLLNEIHDPSAVFVTASTGVAACDLHGQTLHSFAGVGLATGNREQLLLKVSKDKKAYKRWKKVKALVIDEISMVPADLFDNLNYIAKATRPKFKKKPWGGIQLIVSGDFFQLPPIINWESSSGKEFAFEADCWSSCFDLQVELTKIFRQTDSQLVKLLQGIRRGEVNPNDLQILQRCSSEINLDPSVVRLYPRIMTVDRVNKCQLNDLGGDIISYKAIDSGPSEWRSRLSQGLALDNLEISIGARVMLIKNVDLSLKLVNGSTGTVVRFIKSKTKYVGDMCDLGLLPVVKFDSGLEVNVDPDTFDIMDGNIVLASRKQIPLILAWALSIHKCQGMTLSSLHTDLSLAFGCGMIYVALSRLRSLDGLHLSGFNPLKIKAHPKVLQFYKGFAGEPDMDDDDDYTENMNDADIKTFSGDVGDPWGDGNVETFTRNGRVFLGDGNNPKTKYRLTSTNFLREKGE